MASRTEGLRRTERGWTGVAARDPRSYDLPDFRSLATVPTRRSCWRRSSGWSEQVEHAGYCCRPIRIRGRVEQVDRATGEVRGVYSTEGEPDDVVLVHVRRVKGCKTLPCRPGTRPRSAGMGTGGLLGPAYRGAIRPRCAAGRGDGPRIP
jgi:hypothetical protein